MKYFNYLEKIMKNYSQMKTGTPSKKKKKRKEKERKKSRRTLLYSVNIKLLFSINSTRISDTKQANTKN